MSTTTLARPKINLNLFSNTNPCFNELVIEKLVVISKKSAEFVTDEESRLIASVLNSFECFQSLHPDLRDIVTRDIDIELFEEGQHLCRHGETADSAFLILSGKVKVYKPFLTKHVDKRSSVASMLSAKTEPAVDDTQANSGAIMDMGEKVTCQSIDTHILSPDPAKCPTEYIINPDTYVWRRDAGAIALCPVIVAVVKTEKYKQAKAEYSEKQICERMETVQSLNGFGKKFLRFLKDPEDFNVLKSFLTTWKVVMYKANTIITKAGQRITHVIMVSRGTLRSFRKVSKDDNKNMPKTHGSARLLEIDRFHRHEFASGLMEVAEGAAKNIPLYKLKYKASLCTGNSISEIFEIPADAFYSLLVRPGNGKRLLSFCLKYFEVEFLNDAQCQKSLETITSWNEDKKHICKTHIGVTKANTRIKETKTEQKAPLLMPQHLFRVQVTKHVPKSGAPHAVILNCRNEMRHGNREKKRKRNVKMRKVQSTESLFVEDISLLKKVQNEIENRVARAQSMKQLITLPMIVTKEQIERNKERNNKACKMFKNRQMFGRKYDSGALRYWNPSSD